MKIQASNDNTPTLFGVLSYNIDELKSIARTIDSELLCDDVDTRELLAQLKEIQALLLIAENKANRPKLRIIK